MAEVTGAGGRVRVGVLGPVTLDTAAGPAGVGGVRLRVLLARLALDAGRAVRPETLAEALWGGEPPEAPLHALQSLVSRLRRVLGDPGLLVSGPAGYRLVVEPDAVDAVRFERLAREGRRSSARSRPAEAAAVLRAALGLWRGPALADVRAAPFAAAEAERLERARLSALEDRIEADLAVATLVPGADPAPGTDLAVGADLAMGTDLAAGTGLAVATGLDLVGELEALAAAHPLRERLHAQLIRALAMSGRGAEALAAYERVRALLADDFGSDPGPHLQEAHLAVLRGAPPRPRTADAGAARPGPSRADGGAAPPGPRRAGGGAGTVREPFPSRRAHGNLDVPLTSFVGRDGDVRRVAGLLERVRLVTLVGPGGSGKTRLANTVGRRLAPSGGVWFVPLAAAGADDVPRVLLDLLRSREEGAPARPVTPEAVLHHLAETIADDDLVLVLDNCEHVIDAAASLSGALLGRCPKLRVLATSREPLRIDGETLHPVLPLDLPEPGSTSERARVSAAVRLFHDRAAAVRPGFVLEGGALTAVAEICRRLDGLPLAIELAAARLRTLPVEAVAARLDDRFRLLTGGSRTALPRHRTLAAAVAWSWDLLDPGERALLERLSVVRGSFTEDAAAAIGGTGDAPELLAALVDKSLLHPAESADPAEPRYRLLETIRVYGLERLAGRDEVAGTRDRHARFFLKLAEDADPGLRTSGQLGPLARLSAERDNLSAAIRWAAESGDAALAVRFGVALCWFWFLKDFPPDSLDLLGRMLQVRGPAEPRARALVAAAHALATTEAAGPEEAEAAFGRIRTALAGLAPGTHPIATMARLALGIVSEGDRAVPEEGHDPWSRSLSLLVTGVLAMNTGHAAEARDVLSRALTGFEELGERWGVAITLSALGSALIRSGEPAGAPALSERATGYFRELGMPEHTMENEVAAALHRAESGDVDGGRRHLSGLLDQAERTGSAESCTQVRLGLARLEWTAGRTEAARAHALAGLAGAPPGRSTTPPLTALLLGVLAQSDLAEGFPDRAARRLDHPAVRLTLTWHTPVAAATAVVAAAIELGRDRPERAGRLLGAATVLGGWAGPGETDARRLTRRAEAVLGAAGFAAEHAAGAAMSRSGAEGLVSAVITAPVS
ncbi:BTAD domain-containing putative transcriptional regulator [Nonomuraea spiralis]|uniref:BTAD domain-containing putative transcriptional regulator n=1 Tax=Nonomuraea spiralis TaxID=46182 RepID=A0ABV5I7U9_9ACTN|nr:BTAD domain-containing putative transcriptional regulator [Nonomuraea spiralis]GGS66754.1 SARP family transcriptional regulator [Nonomuraea spiralis]